MAEEERLFTIPLRAAWRVPRTRRANRAIAKIREFVSRQMGEEKEKVWVDQPVNEAIWSRSRQHPPRQIRVKAIKFDDGVVEVSLPESEAGSKREAAKQEEPEEETKEPAPKETAKAEPPAPPENP